MIKYFQPKIVEIPPEDVYQMSLFDRLLSVEWLFIWKILWPYGKSYNFSRKVLKDFP